MHIDQSILKTKFFRYEKPEKDVCWIHDQKMLDIESGKEYDLQFIVPDDKGNPKAEALDYLLSVLKNLETVERDCIALIKHFLNLKGDFYLQDIEILNKNANCHSAESTLSFICDDDIYIYIEVGLIELKSHYVLVKYY